MNGQIKVQSQIGVGSKFIVSLPIIEEPTPSAVMLEKA
jgi:signal transduction histidine kinase